MKNHCHRCGKQTNLKKCKHCNEYFCEEHLPAKMCLTRAILDDKKLHPSIRIELEKEWRKEGGHPDAEYTSKRWKGFNKKEELHDKSLIDILKKPSKQEQPHAQRELSPEEPIGKPYEPPFPRQKIHFKFPSNRIIIFLIIAAAVAYFVFLAPQETKSNILLSLEKTKNSFIDGIKNIGSISNLLVNIEDVSKNPEKFAGKNISVSGKYGFNLMIEDFLIDKQGYNIKIECRNNGRVFESGNEYKATGLFTFNEICYCQTRFRLNITEDEWKEMMEKYPNAKKENVSIWNPNFLLLPSKEEGWHTNNFYKVKGSECASSLFMKEFEFQLMKFNETHAINLKTEVIDEKRCKTDSIERDYYLKCL